MLPNFGGTPHCRRCGYEYEGTQDACPRCQFNPKAKGLRIALGFLMAMVILMTAVMLLPVYSILFVRLAVVAFLLSLVTMVVSFLATPHRLGSLFLWG